MSQNLVLFIGTYEAELELTQDGFGGGGLTKKNLPSGEWIFSGATPCEAVLGMKSRSINNIRRS